MRHFWWGLIDRPLSISVAVVPAKRNQRWRRGSTNRRTLILRQRKNGPVIDLSNVTAVRMQLRSTADESGEQYLDLSLANGKIAITALEGKIVVTAAAADTDGVTWSLAYYDLKVWYSNGDVRTWLEGTITLTPGVTV